MKPDQYEAARKELGWTHVQVGKMVGRCERMIYCYANGDDTIPPGVARLLRVLVYCAMRASASMCAGYQCGKLLSGCVIHE